MTQGTSLVFFGNERIATGVTTTAPTLTALIEAGYNVKAVISNYEKGTSRNARTLEIQQVAEAHGIPVLLPNKPSDIIDQIQAYDAEIAVLAAYGKIVPQSIIDIFPKGIVNIHPSLLPLHRGPTPLESVILNGETKTGVSLMSLAKEMDAGPIYGQSEVILNSDESKQELADKLLSIGSAMVIELLPGILDGSVVALPQDDSVATYDNLLKKEDGIIDWNKPAIQIEREIRAYADWPKSKTMLGSREIIITKAHVIPSNNAEGKAGDIAVLQDTGTIIIETMSGSLCIDTLKPAGKNEMTSEAFIAGHRNLL